jgi:hypothetical protein
MGPVLGVPNRFIICPLVVKTFFKLSVAALKPGAVPSAMLTSFNICNKFADRCGAKVLVQDDDSGFGVDALHDAEFELEAANVSHDPFGQVDSPLE